MLKLDLSALGVSEESLIDQVLAQTGLSREAAVIALADRLGVEIMKADDYEAAKPAPVNDGDSVLTTRGAGRAAILTESEQATLREAAAISQRLFS